MIYALFLLAAIGGFFMICASTRRHDAQVFGRDVSRRAALALRAVAAFLLALSWAACAGYWGVAMGSVAWICLLPLAAIAVVVCLTYSPSKLLRLGGIGATAMSIMMTAAILLG